MNQTLATPGSRILATLVDGLMFMVCIGIGLGIMFLVGMIMGDANEDTVSIIVMVVMGTCVLIPWIINVVLISKSGQTVGKKTLGIQMRNKETGQPAGFTDGFLMRSVVFGFVTNIPFVGFLVAIADIIMLFPEGHETIHDRIAKTIVTQV